MPNSLGHPLVRLPGRRGQADRHERRSGPDGGNVGFPTTDPEIAHFKRMIQKVATNITAAEIDGLEKSLVAFRAVKLPAR